MIAHTPRLLIRQLRIEDTAAMNGVLADAVVMRFSDGVKSPEQVSAWINHWVNDLYGQWGFGFWAVVDRSDQRVIGYCGLSRFAGRCTPDETELGFRLAHSYWGRGLAQEAATAVCDYAFNSLRLSKLIAVVDPANVAALRVIVKVGFAFEREVMLDGYDHPDHAYSLVNRASG